ncbi:MAG: VCBS repeat-containing protein [Bacteroidota bacterium]
MKRIIFSFLLSILPFWVVGQQVHPSWQYIEVDDAKGKWGDTKEPSWLRYFGLDMGNINGDDQLDILTGKYVYLNPGGDMTAYWKKVELPMNVDGILLMDVDGDEYADLIAQALPELIWLEATNKKGTEWRSQVIGNIPKTSHTNSQGFERGQLIAGGKEEFVIAGNGNIYLVELPLEPTKEEWPITLVAENTSDEGIGVGDIDGDGDMDLAAGRRPEGGDEPLILVWYENTGQAEVWSPTVIGKSNHPLDRVEIADLNGDRKADIIISEERYPGKEPDGSLFWFVQGDSPKAENWARNRVVTQYSMNNLDIADIDEDGDIDIITNEHKGPRLETQLWENDGKGNFSKVILDTGKENHLGTRLADMDGDGDLDLVGIGWDQYEKVHVWRNDGFIHERPTSPSSGAIQIHEGTYEERAHFVITTPAAIYYYDMAGGGLSRLFDREGKDWINFRMKPWGEYPAAAAAAFRGIPNSIFQSEDGGAGHPGHDQCISIRVDDHTVRSTSKSGKWSWEWTFKEEYAELQILATDPDHAYWFLYEGTPGGMFDPENSYFGYNKGGPLTTQWDYYKGEKLFDQISWAYIGHEMVDRVLLLSQLAPDTLSDTFSYLGNSEEGIGSDDGMVVFGFGRGEGAKPLLTQPMRFRVQFIEQAIRSQDDHAEIASLFK